MAPVGWKDSIWESVPHSVTLFAVWALQEEACRIFV